MYLLPVFQTADISIHAPARGATITGSTCMMSLGHFNPRPREGGDKGSGANLIVTLDISIHAPARGATMPTVTVSSVCRFQSTPPARGATAVHGQGGGAAGISIHAPREGGDF